jgi:hypothetical protein
VQPGTPTPLTSPSTQPLGPDRRPLDVHHVHHDVRTEPAVRTSGAGAHPLPARRTRRHDRPPATRLRRLRAVAPPLGRVLGAHRPWRLRDAGMATAEYALATLAACGFAALLLTLLRSDEVRGLLLGIIRRALAVG